MKLRKLWQIGSASILSTSSLLAIGIPAAFAAAPYTCTWIGGNGDFNTAGNWSNCNNAAPQSGDGDTLIFDNSSLSAAGSPSDDIPSLSVAAVQFTGSNTTWGNEIVGSDALTITGSVSDATTSSAPSGFTNTIVASGSPTVTTTNPNGTLFETLQGSGNIAVTGGGTAEFDDLTSYTGTISSADSIIQLAPAANMTSSGSVAVSGNATLDLFNEGGGKSAATYTYTLPISLGGNGGTKLGTLNLDGAQDSDVSNVLAGPVTLTSDVDVTAVGSNTLNITGGITYNGHAISSVGQNVTTITIPAGDDQSGQNATIGSNVTYYVDGKLGATTISSGGLLKGSGTVGSLTVNSGGTSSPGHSPGCLTVNGDLNETGIYQAEIQSPGQTACTDFDQMVVTGNVNLTGSSLDLSFLGGYVPSAGQKFEIINNQGSNPVTGTFAGLAQGATSAVNGVTYSISYVGGDGNDVVLTVTSVQAAAKAPGTPDTGLAALVAHPATTFVVSTLSALTLFGIARRLKVTSA
jgi:fibronectin-binding autotransporter adhesin